MLKQSLAILFICLATFSLAQNPISKKTDSTKIARDSIRKAEFLKNIGNPRTKIAISNFSSFVAPVNGPV